MSSDAEIGAKARELVQALQDAADLLMVDAPTTEIVKQFKVVKRLAGEAVLMSGGSHDEMSAVFAERQGRIVEVIMTMVAESEGE